ncbi:MAG: hypothetical protein AAF089_13860 [Bacteroidota bacterium]
MARRIAEMLKPKVHASNQVQHDNDVSGEHTEENAWSQRAEIHEKTAR